MHLAHLAIVLLAQEKPPAGQPVAARAWWAELLSDPLAVMLIFIFLTAVISTFIAARKRDRCLKTFHRFAVTVLEQAGRAIWGTLRVFSKGLEITFSSPDEDPDTRVTKRTFLVYENELAKLMAVTRYLDEVTDPHQLRRRKRQIRRMAQPGLATRSWRRLRNFVNTFRDAIVKSFGLAMSQAQKTSKSVLIRSGGQDITQVGSTIVGEVGNAYEPMLERYIGSEVVAEVLNPADPGKTLMEICGYLGEYSAAYVLLLDCERVFDDRITVPEDPKLTLAQQLTARRTDTGLAVEHRGTFPATVTSVAWGDGPPVAVRVELATEGETPVALDPVPPADATVTVSLRVRRGFDIVLPRAIAAVRHHAAFCPTPDDTDATSPA